jgi:hypothetical protein
MRQLDMFETKKDLEILPIRFVLEFGCKDYACKGHKMSILDWEFAQLYRNIKDDPDWKSKISQKAHEICSENKETYIILGNMAKRKHTFCILGFFYPPKKNDKQLKLF